MVSWKLKRAGRTERTQSKIKDVELRISDESPEMVDCIWLPNTRLPYKDTILVEPVPRGKRIRGYVDSIWLFYQLFVEESSEFWKEFFKQIHCYWARVLKSYGWLLDLSRAWMNYFQLSIPANFPVFLPTEITGYHVYTLPIPWFPNWPCRNDWKCRGTQLRRSYINTMCLLQWLCLCQL